MARLRILIHALSLSGAGHYVRARALAGELAQAHHVVLTDAGRPVPLSLPPGVFSLPLDRLQRDGRGLHGDADPAETLRRRRAQLVSAVEALRPDVLLIEHYPFSKWALADEIEAAIAAARHANPGARVICSVRDFPLQTRHEDCDAPAWRARVLDGLHRHFDGLLHHADPILVAFDSVFPGADQLRIPMHATGLVHRVEADDPSQLPDGLEAGRFALCSVGGGSDATDLAVRVREAWRRLRARGALGLDHLVICGAGTPHSAPTHAEGVLHLPFMPRFDVLLRRAHLSLSHAGYNTCADVLRFRIPSVLVAHPTMSDQAPRAALMARIGAATVLTADAVDAEALAQAMSEALSQGAGRRPTEPDLEGARETRRWIEACAAGSGLFYSRAGV